jgi:tetratricopeptide (TPR) repeat protein
MILTNCAACAAPLGLSSGKKCGRCSTRYCGPECQVQHWKEGGHDKLCKLIKKAGGAEQYNANQKYTAAVAVATEACAEDTKGQTCYICTQALHWKTKEGLVRGCSCRGTAGFAHVSCLAEEAKILFAEAEENNLGDKALDARWGRWSQCGLCEQEYHGVVSCALGWACWKTYVGRPEADLVRRFAMTQLGNGLYAAGHYEEALSVQEADLSLQRRLRIAEEDMLVAQSRFANTCHALGRYEDAGRILRDVYSGTLTLYGEEHIDSLLAANNYAATLLDMNRLKEAKALMQKTIPVARRVLGDTERLTLKMRTLYAKALYKDSGSTESTLDDLREAATTFEDVGRIAQRVLGGAHPLASDTQRSLEVVRAELAVREAWGV